MSGITISIEKQINKEVDELMDSGDEHTTAETLRQLKIDLYETNALLTESTEALLRVECQFKFCDGFEKEPENMVTCFRCRMIHEIKTKRPDVFAKASGG